MILYNDYVKTFNNKKVAFCGIGISNFPLVEMYKSFGADVIACDRKKADELGENVKYLESIGVKTSLGENYLNNLDVDIIFRTPGMNFNSPELIEMRRRGVEITSEIEEFFKICPSYIIAVTGSDGKTTTTTLISEILKKDRKNVFLGGNIGEPLLPRINQMKKEDFVVAELSSFQLISLKQSPNVAVVTNISPNHLDVHKDMNEYIEAKKNIFNYQTNNDRLVINNDNEITSDFDKIAQGNVIKFGANLDDSKSNFVFLDNDVITVNFNGLTTPVMPKQRIRIPGEHNVQNYMAAIGAVWGLVNVESIISVAEEFGGVEHRIEFVRELNGVKWYNDSIATSPTRAIAGLNSFNKKITVIAGGYDKHIPFEPFAEKAVEKIKNLILTGDTAEKIEECVKAQPGYSLKTPNIIRVNNMEEAVKIAFEISEPGDVVSLSPACASFDRYKNFALRGNHFKKLVKDL